ncbi:MAG: InlB B-repeat-containing protein, partial [Alphaproteobacteria bacterium]|nr:InlB B-repeat-containing protein [Alphaproteobacteria bacterium]MBN2674850.1 InlB B-repeat-containing protein [Alphaproteobacteria bacterium]
NSQTCTQCTGATYQPTAGSTATSCTACPTNYTANTVAGKITDTQCQLQTTAGYWIEAGGDAIEIECEEGYYCPAALINYGSNGNIIGCPTNYDDGGTGLTAIGSCKWQTTAGTYIANANATSATTCTAGYYCPSALISYGSIGTRTSCPAGYVSGSTGGSVVTDCKWQTAGGTYISTANATISVPCTAGYYCPATLISYGSIGSRIQCTGATYSASSASSCSTCPGSYTANTTAGKTLITQCQIQTTAGTYIASANSSTLSSCPAYNYCPATLISYSSTGLSIACDECNTINANCILSVVDNVCTYTTTCYTGYGNIQDSGTPDASCTANTYTVTFDKQSGTGGSNSVIATYDSPMPAATMPTLINNTFSGYYDSTSGGTQYYTSSGVSARIWDKTSNTTLYAQWSLSGVNCVAGTYLPGNSSTCSTCTAGNYCTGGLYELSTSDQGLTACPTNYDDGGTGLTAQNQCKFQTVGGTYIKIINDTTASTCTAGYYCPAALISYGSTGTRTQCTGATYSAAGASSCISCPASYTANTTAGKTLITQCQISVIGGQYIAIANATSGTNCSAGTSKAAHNVNYGSTSSCTVCADNTYSGAAAPSCTSCLTNYLTYGTAAADHDSVTDCKITCAGGTYIVNANDTVCVDVGNGYWSEESSISQGTVNARDVCPVGYGNSTAPRDSQDTCYAICSAGTYVGSVGSACTTLTTDDKYIIENYVYYGQLSMPDTCNISNDYHIIGKTLATDHDSYTDCKVNCVGGTYVSTINDSCETCPAGKYCPAASISYGSTGSISDCPTDYIDGGTGLSSQNQCMITCDAGTRVATSGAVCTTLTTDNTYVDENTVLYGGTTIFSTCDTASGYYIIGKTLADEHDSINDCYQTCSAEDIAPPAGAIKTPLNIIENYPNFCVYTASCPEGYSPAEGGAFYDDSGYTTDPICESAAMEITFSANGGIISGGGTSYIKTCSVGMTCIFNDSILNTFLRTGYIFGGWSNNSDGSAIYQNGDDIAGLETESLTLFAVWDVCAAGYTWDGTECTICSTGTWSAGGTPASGSAVSCTACTGGTTTSAPGATSPSACISCPLGSFCSTDGSTVTSCSSLGDGSWTNSIPAANTENDCFKDCPSYPVIYGTAITDGGRAFYPNNCQYYCVSDTDNIGEVEGGNCVEKSCKSNFEMIDGICEHCTRDNALSYKASGNCEIESCVSGYHPNGQSCEEDTLDCAAPNSDSAYKTWNSSKTSFGTCKIQTCSYGYHVSSNACVSDEQECVIENGVGTKEWDSSNGSWGPCVVTSCNPGYTSDYSETNEFTKQCGQCKNKFSILGEQAVSSYSRGCEIASCMYQGELYNLENNECVPICDVAGYEDETGTMQWNPSTKRCVRSCKDGYTSWPSYSAPSKTSLPDTL